MPGTTQVQLSQGKMEFMPINNKASEEENFRANADRYLNSHYSPEVMTIFYDKWAEDFEKQVPPGYGAVKECVDMLLSYAGEQKDMKILDIGAGTGLLGEELRKHGFTNIDALDPSEGMLKKAQEKKIYRRTFHSFFTDNVECLQTDVYDCALSTGTFGGNLAQASSLQEIIRCIKPGGHACIITRPAYLTPESPIGQEMARLQKEGNLQVIENKVFPNYVYDADGGAVLFKITKQSG